MSGKIIYSLLIISALVICISSLVQGKQDQDDPENLEQYKLVSDFVKENEVCFVCHGESKYQLVDEFFGRTITQKMCENRIIHREDYYISNHKSFACVDCHSDEYTVFPHALELRLEEPYQCIDCHGYDEDYAHYQFEKIEEEYLESTHHGVTEEFSCWKCHNPHTYHISIRNTENLKETIIYDNAICLSCHANFDRFQLLTDRSGIDIIQHHQWLPNEALHFQNVRCIECHTQINDSILVAHLVLPKEEAVRKCSECHSSNSILMHTLFKFQAREARSEYGFLNAVIMNEAYVIGANRNYILNLISIILFGLTFLGILLHIALRIKNKV